MGFLQAVVAVAGLGVWTAVQPCPMAANIAAISYIGRRLEGPRQVLWAGLLYALGRAAVYVALALLITGGVLSSWRVAAALEASMSVIIGPLLVLAAMVFLDLVGFTMPGAGLGAKVQSRVDAWGLWARCRWGSCWGCGSVPCRPLASSSVC